MILDDFIGDFKLNSHHFSFITRKELDQLANYAYKVEDLLQHLCDNYNVLLHGSKADFPDNKLKSPKGVINAYNDACYAIVKAIVSNGKLKDSGKRIYTFADQGFVYVVPDTTGFRNAPKGTPRYVKKGETIVNAQIDILREDFSHSIKYVK